ncbi:hypothetical protein PVK06_011287 [Gossypium arboreum]|uniref:Aminotransferase-like plant mobile domain-containing protein n=1 Tax=Gossypium arboreum TaxID=29729 RepID=A0ABR0Q8W8_GOSAR|nr:hypothetical protein PVK06_011287 [Gossypium arboreum]
MPTPQDLASDKAKYETHVQILPSIAILGIIRMSFLATVNHQLLSLWMSYSRGEIVAFIPSWVHKQQILFVTKFSLINFNMVEWHIVDQGLSQFDCLQHIPNPLQEFKQVHKIDKKGKHAKNWVTKHAPYIILWNTRCERCRLVCL